jgi:hypothetical protein
MANKVTVKIGPAIDAKLYKEFVESAKENGQTQRYLLEKAIEHYIHNVVPPAHGAAGGDGGLLSFEAAQ